MCTEPALEIRPHFLTGAEWLTILFPGISGNPDRLNISPKFYYIHIQKIMWIFFLIVVSFLFFHFLNVQISLSDKI